MKLTPREQLEVLRRGTIEIVSEEALLDKLARSNETGKPLVVKLGADPTAPDIHLGHTVVLRKLRDFQDLGHDVVFLIGDFTAMIGDPSGASKTRPPLSRDKTRENARTYADQCAKILDPKRTRIAYNSEWCAALTSEEIIQLMSRYTVARLLERDDFQQRLQSGAPISVHELLYVLLQAYDSVALRADVELGGSDQRFNLLAARDIQRAYRQEPQVAVIMPLIVGTDGVQKMSKSLGNTISVTDPPDEIFGRTMSVPDAALAEYYEVASTFPPEEIARARTALETGTENPAVLKRKLARHFIERFWDTEAARAAEAAFDRVHVDHQAPEDMPVVTQKRGDSPRWIVDLLRDADLVSSGGEARRLITQRGVAVDGQVITDPNAQIPLEDDLILRVGKRRFARVKLED